MDARYEPYQQEVLNELIALINLYIRENPEDAAQHEALRDDMREISAYVYNYVELSIAIDDILSKKNFLSIDIIPLPAIEDEAICQINASQSHFKNLLEKIVAVVEKRRITNLGEHAFYKQLHEVLLKYMR